MATSRTRQPARRVLEAVMARQWAITPDGLELVLAVAARANEDPAAVAERLGRELDNTHAVTVRNGVATIPVAGPLFRYANLFTEVSGATSYEDLARDFRAALDNPDVRAILLDIDSPGGEVNGVSELAEQIFAARGRKPVCAYVGGMACSAAYWLAAAADEVVCADTALLGSIGVIATFVDTSVAEEMEGIRVVNIVSSQSPDKLLDVDQPDGRARIQRTVDDLAAVFVSAVAKYRGVSEKVVLAQFGKGDVLVGQSAIDVGLADRLGNYEGEHAELEPGAAAAALTRARRASVRIPVAAKLGDAFDLAALTSQLRILPAVARRMTTVSAGPSVPAAPPAPAVPPAPQKAAHQETAPMKTEDAAPSGATDAAALESARVDTLTALAEEHGVTLPKLRGWIKDKVPVATAQAEIMASYKAGVQPAAQPGAEQLTSTQRVEVGADRAGNKLFASLGEQLRSIIRAGRFGTVDPRLQRINAAVSGMNEGVGSEGGFFIEPVLLPGIIDPVYEEDPILSRVQRIPIAGNGVKFNVVDETSRVTGSRWGGLQVFWAAEGDAGTPKKPKQRQVVLDLKKLIGLAYLTNELKDDAPAAEALLVRGFRAELAFMLGEAVFYGTGAGQPQGFMKSGALVTQAIEATQTIANTNQFIAANVAKMLSRIPASLWNDVIFLYNQELLSALIQATVGASGAVPLFIGAGGLANRPADTILGKPAFGSELCEAVGTPGDLLAIAPSQYYLGEKGGPQQASSIHVRFINDEDTLRITYRVDGQPGWYTTVTPYKGANARSPYVCLNTRS